jgi:hypothetical protein
MHVFGAVRPAFRLLEQFTFTEADRSQFEHLGTEPVLTLRSEEDEGRLDITLLDSPEQLERLARALPKGIHAHVNVSLSCLGDTAWRDRFARGLGRTRVSGLMDLSPMAQFDLWRRDGSSLAYAQATVTDGEGHPAELLVTVLDGQNLPLLTVCTAVTSDILRQYLERTYPGAQADPAVILDRQEDIKVAVSHLLNEEYYFDMAAYA